MHLPLLRVLLLLWIPLFALASNTCDGQDLLNMRQPTLFLAHGGGPLPLLQHEPHKSLTEWLQGYTATLPTKPSAIVLFSAHWEEDTPVIEISEKPELIYDYYGFPDESYKITYKADGSAKIAKRALELLQEAGFTPKEAKRGWDHGVFVPMKLMFPDESVPIVEISLLKSLDPEKHIDMGKALAPLRDENVLIVGSGMSYHNMAGFSFDQSPDQPPVHSSKEFDDHLDKVVCSSESSAEREAALIKWVDGPSARECHPREEHLLPLHVIAGAGTGGKGTRVWHDNLMGAAASSWQFD